MQRRGTYLVGVAGFALLLLVASLLGSGMGPIGFQPMRSMIWSYLFALALIALILVPAFLPPHRARE